MDQVLKAAIHKFAENREIDYISAKNLGNAYGIEFHDEQELVEFKQVIDKYLKTFEEDAFVEIEKICNKNNDEMVQEEYDVEAFAKVNNDQPSGGHIKVKKTKKSKKKKNMKENITLDNFF